MLLEYVPSMNPHIQYVLSASIEVVRFEFLSLPPLWPLNALLRHCHLKLILNSFLPICQFVDLPICLSYEQALTLQRRLQVWFTIFAILQFEPLNVLETLYFVSFEFAAISSLFFIWFKSFIIAIYKKCLLSLVFIYNLYFDWLTLTVCPTASQPTNQLTLDGLTACLIWMGMECVGKRGAPSLFNGESVFRVHIHSVWYDMVTRLFGMNMMTPFFDRVTTWYDVTTDIYCMKYAWPWCYSVILIPPQEMCVDPQICGCEPCWLSYWLLIWLRAHHITYALIWYLWPGIPVHTALCVEWMWTWLSSELSVVIPSNACNFMCTPNIEWYRYIGTQTIEEIEWECSFLSMYCIPFLSVFVWCAPIRSFCVIVSVDVFCTAFHPNWHHLAEFRSDLITMLCIVIPLISFRLFVDLFFRPLLLLTHPLCVRSMVSVYGVLAT